MGNLDRRLARLEGPASSWSLTRLLEWLANPTDEVPSGPLVECLESLPIVKRGVSQ
jgi:hypothetical protein